MGTLHVITDHEELLADRAQAAERLNGQLSDYQDRQGLVVLGIPRGGVLVADPIARHFRADLDVVLTRKLPAPRQPELAVGAVTEAGRMYCNQRILKTLGISADYLDDEKRRQLELIRRRKERYRSILEKQSLAGKVVILTDDGVATGATMQAAVWAVLAEYPKKLILALPVAPPETARRLAQDADETICLSTPPDFQSIGQYYTHFEQVPDERVEAVLKRYAKVSHV